MERREIFASSLIAGLVVVLGIALFAPAQAEEKKTDTGGSYAQPVDAHDPAADAVMDFEQNGYSLAQFKDFQKKWHFVTARYRKDTGEMRLTYANDSAWKALLAHSTDYPDGAVFAKIGFVTAEDPSFTSSLVPTASRRYQLMVRDHKKHAATGGWGFAIFGKFGEVATKDRGTTGELCMACHNAVPEKNYVFSEPMEQAVEKYDPHTPRATVITASSNADNMGALAAKPVFETEIAAGLPATVLDLIPEKFDTIRRLRKPSLENEARGGIGEMRPMLIREAVEKHLPAVLVNAQHDNIFAIAYPRQFEPDCTTPDGKKGAVIVTHFNGGETRAGHSVRTRSGRDLPIDATMTNEFCQAADK